MTGSDSVRGDWNNTTKKTVLKMLGETKVSNFQLERKKTKLEKQSDRSLTKGNSLSIVSVPDGAGQTDGSVHTEVHLLLQLQQGEVDAFFMVTFLPMTSAWLR